jgi:hypothetical protein
MQSTGHTSTHAPSTQSRQIRVITQVISYPLMESGYWIEIQNSHDQDRRYLSLVSL